MNSEELNIKVAEIRPDFMTPKPVSPKRARANCVSILGKRKHGESFNSASFDEERYGQQIDNTFFQHNVGHSVVQEAATGAIGDFRIMMASLFHDGSKDSRLGASEIIELCEFYLKNKNLFNV